MQETTLLFLNDSYLFESTAHVVGVEKTEHGTAVLLDETIFYPQGGGQPCDVGAIESNNGKFLVNNVRFQNGMVYHYGEFESGEFTAGEEVKLSVDEERRKLLSRIHTAGHLVDVAMHNCGFGYTPTKGYHFPDSPYVEYDGVIEPEQREEAKQRIEEEINRLISTNEAVQTQIVNSKEELSQYCKFIPNYIPEGKPIRIVTVAENFGCPCGGTHVKSIEEVGKTAVTRIKVKSGNTRVSYKIEGQ